MYRTRRVESLDGVVGGYEVLTRACLVAQAPDDDAGVVDVCLDSLHDSGHMGRSPFHGMGKTGLSIVVFVALYVGFVLKVQAVLVRKVVEVGIVAVVREADVVDVAAFHEHHFLFHLLASDGVASGGIRLMTVHALELHGLSVDIEVATGQAELVVAGFRVTNLDSSKAEVR